jgi:cytochrome oxidase complex assembly protein 1
MSIFASVRFRSCLIVVTAILVLMLTLPHFLATMSGAYRLAVLTAHRTPLFAHTLGPPISEAWFSDNRQVWSNPATEEMLIPVRGQIRRGNLRARAIELDGEWRLTELTLELAPPEAGIDLLGKAPI